jgi:hypothetical protein
MPFLEKPFSEADGFIVISDERTLRQDAEAKLAAAALAAKVYKSKEGE